MLMEISIFKKFKVKSLRCHKLFNSDQSVFLKDIPSINLFRSIF